MDPLLLQHVLPGVGVLCEDILRLQAAHSARLGDYEKLLELRLPRKVGCQVKQSLTALLSRSHDSRARLITLQI